MQIPKDRLGNDETESTRVVSHSFDLDGIQFSWWAVGEQPALVTVSSQWFGRKAEFHPTGDEVTARKMASTMLEEQYQEAEKVREQLRDRADRRTIL